MPKGFRHFEIPICLHWKAHRDMIKLSFLVRPEKIISGNFMLLTERKYSEDEYTPLAM
jgi:hypothetical protein